MLTRQPSSMVVVKQEEKEQKLRDFCQAAMAGEAPLAPVLVLARSVESPVVAALVAMLTETGRRARTLRLVLSTSDGLAEHMLSVLADTVEVAQLRRHQLLEAHEMLVLGHRAVWTGDCMRRDPRKRDAFESHVLDCGETQRAARTSFERLSRHAEALFRTEVKLPIQDGLVDTSGLEIALGIDGVPSTATVSSTH